MPSTPTKPHIHRNVPRKRRWGILATVINRVFWTGIQLPRWSLPIPNRWLLGWPHPRLGAHRCPCLSTSGSSILSTQTTSSIWSTILASTLRSARSNAHTRPLSSQSEPLEVLSRLYWWGATLLFRSIIQIPRYNIRSCSMVWDIVGILCLSHVLRPWLVDIIKHF